MLLTTDAALLCSSDYSAGMYFQDPDAVHMLRQIYNSCYDQCTRLFEAFPIVPDRVRGISGHSIRPCGRKRTDDRHSAGSLPDAVYQRRYP